MLKVIAVHTKCTYIKWLAIHISILAIHMSIYYKSRQNPKVLTRLIP